MGQFTVLTPLPGTQLYRERYSRASDSRLHLLRHAARRAPHAASPGGVLPAFCRALPPARFQAVFRPDRSRRVDHGAAQASPPKTKTMRQWELYAENDPILGRSASRSAEARRGRLVTPALLDGRIFDDCLRTIYRRSTSIDERRPASNETILDRLFHHAREIPDRRVYAFLRDDAPPETITLSPACTSASSRLARRFRDHGRRGRSGAAPLSLGPGVHRGLSGMPGGGDDRRARPVAAAQSPQRAARSISWPTPTPGWFSPRPRLLRSHGHLPVLQSAGGRVVLGTEDFGTRAAPDLPWPLPEPGATAFLQYTSGSTGNPRGVIVTHGNIISNEVAIREEFGHTRESIGCLWLPLFHDMGLIGGVLQPLFTGFFTAPARPSRSSTTRCDWLRAISKYRATTAGAPNFAYDYCVTRVTDEQKRDLDLSSVKVLFNGAEPIRAETLSRFTRAFAPCGLRPEAVYPCYGLAEVDAPGRRRAARRARRGELWVGADGLESRRRPPGPRPSRPALAMPGQQRAAGRRNAAGHRRPRIPRRAARRPDRRGLGELRQRLPGILEPAPRKAEETFRATLEQRRRTDCTFLRTGDLGFMESGHLFVTGRIKDLIIIHGRNVYPHDVEAVVQRACECLGPNSCAAFGVADQGEERLALVIEATRAVASRLRAGRSRRRIAGRRGRIGRDAAPRRSAPSARSRKSSRCRSTASPSCGRARSRAPPAAKCSGGSAGSDCWPATSTSSYQWKDGKSCWLPRHDGRRGQRPRSRSRRKGNGEAAPCVGRE